MLRPCRSAKRNGRVHTEWTSALYGERIAVTYEKGYTSVNFLRPLTWKRLLCRASLPNPPGPPYQGGKTCCCPLLRGREEFCCPPDKGD